MAKQTRPSAPPPVDEVQELKPTLGKQLRQMRETGVVLPFPSGSNYRVRVVGAANMLRRGNLPNVLLTFVTDAIYHGVTADKIDKFMTLQEKEEHATEFLDSLKACCEEVFLEPRIVDNPQADDEISIADLHLQDQAWAFDLAFGFARELRPFRPQQGPDVVSLPVTEDVPQTT